MRDRRARGRPALQLCASVIDVTYGHCRGRHHRRPDDCRPRAARERQVDADKSRAKRRFIFHSLSSDRCTPVCRARYLVAGSAKQVVAKLTADLRTRVANQRVTRRPARSSRID